MKRGGLFALSIFLSMTLASGRIVTTLGASLVPICQILGSGFNSPYYGLSVQTQGVVSADFDDDTAKGFFMQEDDCDSDPATLDGIFVHLGERIGVIVVGDMVSITEN